MKNWYRLQTIGFKNGPTIDAADLIVLVGPNNSGKSLCLKEILHASTNQGVFDGILFDSNHLVFSYPTDFDSFFSLEDVRYYGKEPRAFRGLAYTLHDLHTAPESPNRSHVDIYRLTKPGFASVFGRLLVAYFSTEYRLALVKSMDTPGPDDTKGILPLLYKRPKEIEAQARSVIKDAFGVEIALDYTALRTMQLKIGKSFSSLPPDPRDARSVLEKESNLDEQGDGIRSFVGIIVGMLATNRSMILIDEPEVFLHPPQAHRIGRFLAEQSGPSRQVIIATHSTDVLRVCPIRGDRLSRIGHANPTIPQRLDR